MVVGRTKASALLKVMLEARLIVRLHDLVARVAADGVKRRRMREEREKGRRARASRACVAPVHLSKEGKRKRMAERGRKGEG